MKHQIFSGFWHNLYIRRLPGPSPRFLLGFYPYSHRDFQDSEGKTYQKPIRTNKEKIWEKKHIKCPLYSFFSYFYLRNFFRLPYYRGPTWMAWCLVREHPLQLCCHLHPAATADYAMDVPSAGALQMAICHLPWGSAQKELSKANEHEPPEQIKKRLIRRKNIFKSKCSKFV